MFMLLTPHAQPFPHSMILPLRHHQPVTCGPQTHRLHAPFLWSQLHNGGFISTLDTLERTLAGETRQAIRVSVH